MDKILIYVALLIVFLVVFDKTTEKYEFPDQDYEYAQICE